MQTRNINSDRAAAENGISRHPFSWSITMAVRKRRPVPWQQEIADGIETCSKCVCFIDVAYITSFNCLMVSAVCLKRLLHVVGE